MECSNGSTSQTGACPAGADITGPVLLYLQQAGVGGLSVEEAGTQDIPQTELALFVQDKWQPSRNLTVQYGLRWEMQKQADPITPASEVFYAPFIGKTVTNCVGTGASRPTARSPRTTRCGSRGWASPGTRAATARRWCA